MTTPVIEEPASIPTIRKRVDSDSNFDELENMLNDMSLSLMSTPNPSSIQSSRGTSPGNTVNIGPVVNEEEDLR